MQCVLIIFSHTHIWDYRMSFQYTNNTYPTSKYVYSYIHVFPVVQDYCTVNFKSFHSFLFLLVLRKKGEIDNCKHVVLCKKKRALVSKKILPCRESGQIFLLSSKSFIILFYSFLLLLILFHFLLVYIRRDFLVINF